MIYGNISTAVPTAKNNFTKSAVQSTRVRVFTNIIPAKPSKKNNAYLATELAWNNHPKNLAELAMGTGNEVELSMKTEIFTDEKPLREMLMYASPEIEAKSKMYRREVARSRGHLFYASVTPNDTVTLANYELDDTQEWGKGLISIRRDTIYPSNEQIFTQKIKFYNREFSIQDGVDGAFEIKRCYEFEYIPRDFDNFNVFRDFIIAAWHIQRGNNSIIRVCLRGQMNEVNGPFSYTIDFETEDPEALSDVFMEDCLDYLGRMDVSYELFKKFLVCDDTEFTIVDAPTYPEILEVKPEHKEFALFMIDCGRIKMLRNQEEAHLLTLQFNQDPNAPKVQSLNGEDLEPKIDSPRVSECEEQLEEIYNDGKRVLENDSPIEEAVAPSSPKRLCI